MSILEITNTIMIIPSIRKSFASLSSLRRDGWIRFLDKFKSLIIVTMVLLLERSAECLGNAGMPFSNDSDFVPGGISTSSLIPLTWPL